VTLIAELTDGDPAERTAKVLAEVGLSDRSNHFPGQLSGGEQQRVSIARGLVKNPPLMLCDEPTGSLDTDMGTQILELLRDVTADAHRTVLTVTHNSVIAEMADRVIELRDGEIVGERVNPSPADPKDLAW
jgi:putative ABC transport system ATP-binding protein